MRVRNNSERELLVVHATGAALLAPGGEAEVPDGTALPPDIVPVSGAPPSAPPPPGEFVVPPEPTESRPPEGGSSISPEGGDG